MSKNKDVTEEVVEEVTEEVPAVPKTMSISDKIQEKLAAAKKAQEVLTKQTEELEKISNIGDTEMASVDAIAALDKDIAAEKAKLAEAVKPYNESIAAEKAKFDGSTKTLVEARKAEYDKLVESVGENGAGLLCGKVVAVSTGTGKGRGRGKGNAKRAQAVAAICDEGLTFEEAALKYDHMGDAERPEYTGDKPMKVGNLVKRHLDLSVTEDGTVVKNDDGTYSRA